MAKPNFQFQKRQKELERKKKNEDKLQRKLAKNVATLDDPAEESSAKEGTGLGD